VRVLITGAGGQLGREFAELIPEAAALDRRALAIEDQGAVERAFGEHQPELVLNCAAYNAVDRAESEPEAAMAVNAVGPANLARAAAARGARFVHFSTNYVFDGRLGRPAAESDPPRPLSAYGRSKWEGERGVLAAAPGALVVRGAGLFGLHGSAAKGGSFPERMLARARSGEPLRVVADQFVNPTYTRDLAAAVLPLASSGMSGVVHVVPFDCCSWYEFTVELVRAAGVTGVDVAEATTGEFAAAAARPLQGCMVSERVPPLRSWRTGLADWWEAYRRQGD
jgi:dTDP-4-dehydrorhamnose reductase